MVTKQAKPQPTMTPDEEAEWLEMMRRGELPPGPWSSETQVAANRYNRIRWQARQRAASREGKRQQGRLPSGGRCIHHYLLESPNGPVTKGVCKKCGHRKEFPNSAESADDELERELRRRATIKMVHAATYRRRGIEARHGMRSNA